MTRVFIYNLKGEDISDSVSLKNGKSNPFGWFQYELWYENSKIGWVESGEVSLDTGFTKREIIE